MLTIAKFPQKTIFDKKKKSINWGTIYIDTVIDQGCKYSFN